MKDQYFPDGIPSKKELNKRIKLARDKMEYLREAIMRYDLYSVRAPMGYYHELFNLTKFIYIHKTYLQKKSIREEMLKALELGMEKSEKESLYFALIATLSIMLPLLGILFLVGKFIQ